MRESHLDSIQSFSFPANSFDDHPHLLFLSRPKLAVVQLSIKQLNLVWKWFIVAVLPGHFKGLGAQRQT